MAHRLEQVFGRFLTAWIDGASRRGGWVLALAVTATAAVGFYVATTLSFNTETTDMIDESLPFRQAAKAYDRAFPQSVDNLVVVVDGDTPGLAEDGAAALARRLEQQPGVFKTVYRPGGDPFFTRNGLLYLDLDELGELADNLADVQPLIGKLVEDTSLRGLFTILEEAVENVGDGEAAEFDLADAFDRLSDTVEAALAGRRHHLSWHEVISGETASIDQRRRFVVLQPRRDFTSLAPDKASIEAVRALARELELAPENGVRVRLTGSVALSHDQLTAAGKGAALAAPVAFILVGLVLFLGLRSARLVAAALVTLSIGLVWTAGFAALAIGELNLISISFAVLFIGLGAAFSIHMCLRYRELVDSGRPHAEAVATAGRDVGSALFLCAATTAAGFYVFIPTDYAGVSELGLIAGTGMFISLFANYTVLPALLGVLPLRSAARPGNNPRDRQAAGGLLDFPTQRRNAVRVGAAVLAVGSVALLPHAWFDFNPLNLHDQTAESVTTLRDLLRESERSPWPLDVLVDGLAEAEVLAARLASLDEVDSTLTISDYVPDEQDEKLALIEEMAFFMGPPPVAGQALPPPSGAERRAALDSFATALDAWLAGGAIEPSLEASARRLAANLKKLADQAAPGEAALGSLERSLLGTFPERLRRLFGALVVTEPVTIEDLPRALVERYVAADGRVRVQVFSRDDLSDNEVLRRFVSAVRTVAPGAVGSPVSVLESGDAVVRAFRQALVSALAVVVALLLVLMRRLADVALVTVPLLLAAVLTVAASVVFDIPFNFANVIVLPLLFGTGVDSAIHFVYRHRIDASFRTSPLRTSTARAVVFSGLTTICSFGSLALSTHRGTATMGELLTIGISFMVICTLIVLPALLHGDQGSARRA